MKKMNWFLVVIMLFGACFVACTDDDDNGGSWDGESVTVDCDPYDAWSYFSFQRGEDGENVESEEYGRGCDGSVLRRFEF